MEKKKICFDAIQELKVQHGSGYELMQRIKALAKADKLNSEMASYFEDFRLMYTHHAAYEDTVIFPSFEAMENRSEINELADTLESEEKRVLGHRGFGDFVDKIAGVEKKLGIYELSTSTPKLK
jgi:hypothetical protein